MQTMNKFVPLFNGYDLSSIEIRVHDTNYDCFESEEVCYL